VTTINQGPQPERHDSSIGLLAHFQGLISSSWQAHGDQHALEDKALGLALMRVADNAAALDKALALALTHVDQNHATLRELLSARIDSLTLVVDANEANGVMRVEQARNTVEQLKTAEHRAIYEHVDAIRLKIEQNLIDYRAHTSGMSDQRLLMLERLTAQEREAHQQTHVTEQRAIEIAKEGQDARLLSMNEFRDQLREQAATFPSRDYVDTLARPLQERLALLEQHANDSITRPVLDARVGPLEIARANQVGSERTLAMVYAALIFVVPIALHYLLPR